MKVKLPLGHEKHSNSRGSNSSGSKDGIREGTGTSRHWSSCSSRDDSEASKESRTSRKHVDENVQSTQDMDISPGDSTPTSEMNYSHLTGISQGSNVEQNPVGPVLLATALPRLISHPMHLPSTPNSTQPESSPLANQQSTPSMVPPPTTVTTSNAPGPPINHNTHLVSSSPIENDNKLHRQSSHLDGSVHSQPLTVETNHTGAVPEGPPTPTHSETPDCAKGILYNLLTQ